MTVYAADGSINVTVVNGATRTGLYAANGSINVTQDATVTRGYYHPCGAVRVTRADGTYKQRQHPDGSIIVVTTPYAAKYAQRITVVAGSLS